MMPARLLLLSLLLILSAAPLPAQTGAPSGAAQGPAPVAMVTSVAGTASLQRAAAVAELAIGADLAPGDIVAVETGTAAVMFHSGSFVELRAGERLTLGASLQESALESPGGVRGPKLDGALTVQADPVEQGRRDQRWKTQLALASGVRGSAAATALSPRLAVADARQVFVWYDADSAARGRQRGYVLVLRDPAGKTLLRQTVQGTVGSFPATAPVEVPGAAPGVRCSWGIFAEGEAVPEGELPARFVFVDAAGRSLAAERRQRLDALHGAGKLDDASRATLLATGAMDERERLFAEAVPPLLSLLEQPAGRSWAAEQLAWIFLRFGNAAAPAAAQAAALSGRP